MRTFKRREGQTLIETAFVLFLLLLILLGITEFSRAWYTKNSLKNAARQGARVAVVTPHITSISSPASCGVTCPPTLTTPPCTGVGCNNSYIEAVVCCSTGLANDTTTNVSITVTDSSGAPRSGDAQPGDAVSVSATTGFSTIVPMLLGSFIPSPFSTAASMRYE